MAGPARPLLNVTSVALLLLGPLEVIRWARRSSVSSLRCRCWVLRCRRRPTTGPAIVGTTTATTDGTTTGTAMGGAAAARSTRATRAGTTTAPGRAPTTGGMDTASSCTARAASATATPATAR